MKLNKKHWVALAAVAIALLGLIGAAYWVMNRSSGEGTGPLDLTNEQNRQRAYELMDKGYGKENYDKKRHCWVRGTNGSDACLVPVMLDRVATRDGQRLYLLTGNVAERNGFWTTMGAFIFDENSREIAANPVLLEYITDDKTPASARLIRLKANGDMAWLLEEKKMKSYPIILAPNRHNVIVSVTGQVFGKLPSDEGASYVYQADPQPDGNGFYPLTLKISGGKNAGTFHFKFDADELAYACVEKACEARWNAWADDNSDEPGVDEDEVAEDASSQPPANANAALFDDGNTLSAADLKDVLAGLGATYVVKDQDTWGFVTDKCRTPFKLSGGYPDNHKEDHGDIWIQGGDSCTSGSVGQSLWFFARDDSGHLRASFGVPANKFVVVTDGENSPDDNPRNDMRLSGNGFCESLWRWDGKQYQRLRNEATQPGGCDHEPAAAEQ